MKTAGVGLVAIAAIATAAAVALFKLTADFAKQGDQLAKTSKAIGVGVVQLQKWQFAVERSGGDSEKFVKGLIKMRVELERVALGETAESASAFARLNINIEDLTTGSIPKLEELLPRIADELAAMTDKQEAASLVALIFGSRLAKDLTPFLLLGAKGIKLLGEEGEKFGFISEEAARKAEDFVDAQRNLTQSTTSLKSIIATELMPRMTDIINNLALWISKNDELIGQKVEGMLSGLVEVLPNLIALAQSAADTIGTIAKAVRDVKTAAVEVNTFLKQFAPEVKKGQPGLLDFLFLGLGKGILVAEEAKESVEHLEVAWIDLNETLDKTPPKLDKVFVPLEKGAKVITEAEQALLDFAAAQEAFTQSIDDQIASIERELEIFFLTREELIKYEAQVLRTALANEEFNEAELEKINLLEKERLALLNLESVREQVDAIAAKLGGQLAAGFAVGTDAAEDELDSLGVFAAAVAANINTAFADTLTELIFDFENFGDAIKNVLRSILNAFFQMIATIATNPIRIGLESSLSGGGGGAGIGSIIGGLGSSFGALGSLFGIGGGGAAIGGAGSVIGSLTGGAVASSGSVIASGAGFLGTLGAAIPAIGAIIAAAAIAIPLILQALEKKPRLDIDIGVIKDEMGKRGALIGAFLDPELIDDLINISVKRKAGLGVGGDDKIKQLISDSIVGAIESIQAIIRQLPTDLFETFNELLLNAEIDIESLIKGDKLLEFDESKKIAQRFQQFLEGDLPARLFASIRDTFFAPLLIGLGVAADAVEVMMDDFLASLQGATREERILLGQEFLATIDAYVDIFNLLNEGMKGVMGKALDDIRALTTSLDIASATGIPTLKEIEAALQDLFETGMLTAQVAQDFLALRAAVIALTVSLVQSISSITAIIAQLDSDIVGLGGSAIGTTAGIEEAIEALQNLLDNEALSLDEREAILNELNSLADQLAASAIATAQQGIQANINALNSQIQNLQLLKTVEADKNQAALEALNKELSLVQEIESLIESIRSNISSLLLAPGGPESVFERIARAQGEIANLFDQLASASPEDQAGIAAQIQDLLNELNQLRLEAFQAPSAESDDLFREIIGGLELLEGLLEPARSSEEIQASIETIELASQVLLSSIDSQIASFQSQLTSLQSTGNQLTGAVADRVRELKEAIRDEFILILEERLEQLGEISETGLDAIVEIEQEALVVLRDNGASLQAIANFTGQMAAQAVAGGAPGLLIDNNIPIPGFAHGSNGIQDFGSGTLALLHGKEAVVPENTTPGFISGRIGDVYLTLPPMTFSRSQVVDPEAFMKELMKRLHDRRVTDEIAKVMRGQRR